MSIPNTSNRNPVFPVTLPQLKQTSPSQTVPPKPNSTPNGIEKHARPRPCNPRKALLWRLRRE
ncbi:hypothetical protein B9Z19DRAFT_1071837 [Tuber borchii]|uniref:Uncharacterized protein n=1 Tax=Tuber borchii TaxID=42251 RepID=A0A2T7A7F5_TUBBO|nr:hypothetical protein B9Z19DRAFT_1071837 [Tuber borchii]